MAKILKNDFWTWSWAYLGYINRYLVHEAINLIRPPQVQRGQQEADFPISRFKLNIIDLLCLNLFWFPRNTFLYSLDMHVFHYPIRPAQFKNHFQNMVIKPKQRGNLRDKVSGRVIYRLYPCPLSKRLSGSTFLSGLRWYILDPPRKG